MSPRVGDEVPAMVPPKLGILPDNPLSQAGISGSLEFDNPQLYVRNPDGMNSKGSDSFW